MQRNGQRQRHPRGKSPFITVLLLFFALAARIFAIDVSAAITWYDTLGFPDVKDLPYVRVATDSYVIRGNNAPESRYAEGFLISDDTAGFTVFLCSPPNFADSFGLDEPYPPLTVKHFVRKARPATSPYPSVNYEVLDLPKVVTDLLAKIHDIQSGPKDYQERRKAFDNKYPALRPMYNFAWGRPVTYRARIFGFARGCQQKGFTDAANELFELVADIPDEQTNKFDPAILREKLQQDIGEAVLTQTEEKFGWSVSTPLPELLRTYESFPSLYPANSRIAYAQESADLLRTMIAEEAAHHPKPLGDMSPAEQIAEQIYQLRFMKRIMWIMYQHYPLRTDKRDGGEGITPIHRLVDWGNAAVPQLIDALDNRRFTRSLVPSFNGNALPRAMRVSDIAQHILEHLSGRNFYAGPSPNGKPPTQTTKQQAEAWWREVGGKGEKEVLIETTSQGKQLGLQSARKLVEKYPNDALPAIEAALRVTSELGYRGEYVQAAGSIPGDLPLAFLRGQLISGHDAFSQVQAARALLRRGQPEAVPAIIDAWRRFQPRFAEMSDDAFSQAGSIISFLATSGDPRAIDALAAESKTAPVQVRYALVGVYRDGPFNGGGSGLQVPVYDRVEKLPGGAGDAAIERSLIASLDDRERCYGPEGKLAKASFADPRICDFAAYVLSDRWPDRYAFRWTPSAAECDPQIAKMRDQWRTTHGLPPIASTPTASAPAISPAPESEVAPLLHTYLQTPSEREATAAKIVDAFGLRALPVVRARLEKSASSAEAPLRPLALRLAAIVSEVRVTTDAGAMAEKSRVATLRGKVLTGAVIDEFARRLESEMPPEVSTVTFDAERTGNDDAGFQITIAWQPIPSALRTGWSRELAVRAGDKTVYRATGWSADRGTNPKTAFRQLAEAFDTATQAAIDTPVLLHLRLVRKPAN